MKKKCPGHGSISIRYMSIKKNKIFCSFLIIYILPFCFLYGEAGKVYFEEKKIEDKKIEIIVPISGITQAYNEYDIKAGFDGKVVAILPSLFDVVKASSPIVRLVTGEVAALLKTAKDENEKKEILKRWKGLFNYTDIQAPHDGIVTRIYVKDESFISKGDKIMTIARNMRVIAKNTEEIYIPLEKGLNGIVEDKKLGKYKLTLYNFIPDGKYFYKLFFDFEEIPQIKLGEKVEGVMMIAKKQSARVVPSDDIIEHNGKKYILLEFEPGLITSQEVEIAGFRLNYLRIKNGD
ncbi:MAG: biotin/lipoyl-binding protein [Elusimicrobiota bacterium]